MCVCVRERQTECVCQCCTDVAHFLHADSSVPAQVMLMRRRGYGGAAEGHIHLVCYPFMPTAQCYNSVAML